MRNDYIAALYDLAAVDERILALVADNGAIVYDRFRRDFPGRFINFGIAEANMVSVAAGLAACGKIPFAYTIAGFLTNRAFEQIRNDVCLQRTNVKLVGIGTGFVYSDLGPTHHTVEDITLMRSLPGMTVFSPADGRETRFLTQAAARWEGPVYLRLATGRTPDIYESDIDWAPGRAVVLRGGADLTLVSTGAILYEVLRAAETLGRTGLSVRVINIHTIKPLDGDTLLCAARETGALLTVEEHTLAGGLGSAVAETLLEAQAPPIRFKRLGLNDTFPVGYGTYPDMKKFNGLSESHIVRAALDLMELPDGDITRYCNQLA